MKGVWTAILLTLLTAAGAIAVPMESWQDGARRVWVGEARDENGQIVVPIEIDDLAKVVAIDLNLVFDGEAFVIAEMRKTGLLTGFFAIHNVVGVDTLKIAIAGAQEGKGSGAFVEIVVEGGDVPEFGLALVVLNGGLIPVAYDMVEKEAPQDSTAVGEIETLPDLFRLEQNYPNPFNPTTTIPFVLPERGHVRLAIFNVMGQRLWLLVDGERPAGAHEVVWDGRDENGTPAASGTFFYRLQTGASTRVRRMLLLR